MTVGRLAVIGVAAPELVAARAELEGRGAEDVAARDLGDGRVVVCGRFSDEAWARAVVARLRGQGWAAAQQPADDDPWITAWRNRSQPISVASGRLLVCLPWVEGDGRGTSVLAIDPGGAFGAGTHPTTHLLLEALAARLRGGETVLDVGCGSGVLALAALRLGAAVAVGIDVDPAAVGATRANAQRNGLAARMTTSATPLPAVDGLFDVVLANITADVLHALAPDLARRLAPGGWLGLSGISPAQVSRLAAAFPSMPVMATPELDDWAALLVERPAAAAPPA
jgi:ribosomal protein L11 methyltransferase